LPGAQSTSVGCLQIGSWCIVRITQSRSFAHAPYIDLHRFCHRRRAARV
jgi:uncharacterized protein YraI